MVTHVDQMLIVVLIYAVQRAQDQVITKNAISPLILMVEAAWAQQQEHQSLHLLQPQQQSLLEQLGMVNSVNQMQIAILAYAA